MRKLGPNSEETTNFFRKISQLNIEDADEFYHNYELHRRNWDKQDLWVELNDVLLKTITKARQKHKLNKAIWDLENASANPKPEKINELKKIKCIKDVNIMKGLRTFTNEDNLLVAKILFGSTRSLSLSELRSIIGIKTNDLNHRLDTLRKADVVVKEEDKYILTVYGAILVQGYNNMETSFENFILNDVPLFDNQFIKPKPQR